MHGDAPAGAPVSTEAFDRDLATEHLAGFWTARVPAHRPQPPFLWRWAPVEAALARAAREIGMAMAERRVIKLSNPHLPSGAASRTLQFNFSIVNGGERAVTHRHSIAAVRFVLQGEGGYTTVDGSRCDMQRGDFILTPAGSWHDHTNLSTQPLVWLDGLDGPLVQALNLAFFEDHAVPEQPVQDLAGPPLRVPWAQAHAALQAAPAGDDDPDLGACFHYPALPTLACTLLRQRAGQPLRRHRSTRTALFHVVDGHGSSQIGDTLLAWAPGDTFVVPPWSWCQHTAAATRDALLFMMDDSPALQALGMLRKEAP